ncbi:hypothetical protein Tco_0990330 [Tanacetum coccineum]|uniref:Uncharacterized protein n=1 Tax=Tanacetum coccineum TaxID=301880 RepID=A0ABQ5EW56_9ASTR
MRNKPGMDSLSFDNLYNNLRVFENDVKGSTPSSSNLQNVAFVSENTSNTNDVSTAHGVSNTSSHYSRHEQTSSYSLLASQSSCRQLDHEDLDQVDEYDLEENGLENGSAMNSIRTQEVLQEDWYAKGQTNWAFVYPRDSSFDLESYSDSDYAGANLDRKSTTGGCQFLGRRLITWQCKKQTIVATSTTEAEYVAAASCCGHLMLIPISVLGCFNWDDKSIIYIG